MGYKTKSMIYALTFGSKEKEQTGMKTPFDVRLSGGLTQKFEGKPFVKSEKEKKEPLRKIKILIVMKLIFIDLTQSCGRVR